VKPQFLIVLIVVGFGELIFYSGVFALIQFAAALLTVGVNESPAAYVDWVRNLVAFDDYAAYGTTLSFQHFFARLLQLFGLDSADWTWFKPGFIVAVLTLFVMVAARSKIRASQQMRVIALSSVCLGATFVSDTVFGYYGVVALICAWMTFHALNRSDPPLVFSARTRRVEYMSVVVVVLSSVTFVIPASGLNYMESVISGPVLLFQLALLSVFLPERHQKQMNGSEARS